MKLKPHRTHFAVNLTTPDKYVRRFAVGSDVKIPNHGAGPAECRALALAERLDKIGAGDVEIERMRR